MGFLRDIYIRFMVWLGAEPPEGYDHLVQKIRLPARHTVKQGETLFVIARQYGVHYDRIAQANNIKDLESIRAGQTLTIPGPDWTPSPPSEPSPPEPSEPAQAPVVVTELEPEQELADETEDILLEEPEDILLEEVEDEPPAEPVEIPPAEAEEVPLEEVVEVPFEELEAGLPDEDEDVPVETIEEAVAAVPPEQLRFEPPSPLPRTLPSAEEELIFRYEVQRGDTLSAIGKRFGVTLKDLVEANDLVDTNRIYPGQKLLIPGYRLPKPETEPEPAEIQQPIPELGEHFIYTMAAGDTLNSVAKRYGITVRELIEANAIEDPTMIRIGQRLIIPGVIKPEPKPAVPAEAGPDYAPPEPSSIVRAIYVSYFAAGHAQTRQHIFDLLRTTELNAVVLDLKSDHGLLSYPSQVPLAREIGAIRPAATDFQALLAYFQANNIYTIARIVTFKDSPLATSYPDLAAKTDANALWQDAEQAHWSDPFLQAVWDYNIQIAIEAAKLGFDEIQFDNVRFPLASQAGAPYFSQELSKETRVNAVLGFLSMAHGQLQPLNVKIGARVFGYACWRTDDSLIGQDIGRMSQYLDVLCPMLFPSTFHKGIPGYPIAVAHPYEIVNQSTLRAIKRIKSKTCLVRPWIQDFQDYRFDKRVYGKQEIQAQIRGCFDAGAGGYMVWNPQVTYTNQAYAPLSLVQAASL